MSKIKTITKNDFIERSKDSNLIQIDKSIYDVTQFVEHPGGPEALENNVGLDATSGFDGVGDHETEEILPYLEQFYIGQLEGFEETETAHDKRKRLLNNKEKKPVIKKVDPSFNATSKVVDSEGLSSNVKLGIALLFALLAYYFFFN
eukprot:TRINITY_DN3205_c0_g1_i2.p1 TRINITY_DN3205_c0_g1~~TRINITY_DN3205_c0_g1_i2.p1  ORF type:complete len:147 (-),score=38.63 TRINITY_DN3205_c0_g1_i2:50-490(-)